MIAARLVGVGLLALLASATSLSLVNAAPMPPANNSTVPADGPAYGVNNSTFQRLWSEDTDNGELSIDDIGGHISSRPEFALRLAQSTDIPFSHPPAAVGTWNRGDFGDYTSGDRDASVHPEGADLVDGLYIEDAFVSIYAVQPSTIRHHGNGPTHTIAPDGHVRSISDYRVVVPDDDRRGPTRERWSVMRTRIDPVVLFADGRRIDRGKGHQATLRYTELSAATQLTVEANITVRLRHATLECPDWNASTTTCDGDWQREVETPEVSKTVSTSQPVTVSRLTGISGKRVQFEARKDRAGAVIHSNTEWATITIAGAVRARSNWWFYTAGRPGWQTMVTSTADGRSRAPSSVRPVQTHAYPAQEAVYVPTESTGVTAPLVIEKVWGSHYPGPSLPSTIDLEPADPYRNADSLAVTSTTHTQSAFQEVTVSSIVHGHSRTVTLSEQQTVRETNLTLTVTDANATRAIIRATVTETTTGDAVTTGRVTAGNQTAPLNSTGMAVLTVAKPRFVVRGRYEPVAWWRTDRPYAASEAVTKLPTDFPDPRTFIQLVVVTGLWFVPLAVLTVGLDYMSGGALLGLTSDATHDE